MSRLIAHDMLLHCKEGCLLSVAPPTAHELPMNFLFCRLHYSSAQRQTEKMPLLHPLWSLSLRSRHQVVVRLRIRGTRY